MQLEDFILNLPAQLTPLRSVAERLAASDLQILENCVEFSHRPKVGPQAYAMTLFKPLSPTMVARYEDVHSLSVSPHYVSLLSSFNGAYAFQVSLYGIPASMANDRPLLSRSVPQPHDLATAKRFWKQEYEVAQEWFLFGSGPLSDEENVGYFFDERGNIQAARKNKSVLSSWSDFSGFLSDELTRCEAMYPDFEASMAEAIQATEKPRLSQLFSRRGTSA